MAPHRNAPAYPSTTAPHYVSGMSIRTWLVGQCLRGLANCLIADGPDDLDAEAQCNAVAKQAVMIADLALAEMADTDRPHPPGAGGVPS
jgi:hypothetical protein